jgi:hypothetical protein
MSFTQLSSFLSRLGARPRDAKATGLSSRAGRGPAFEPLEHRSMMSVVMPGGNVALPGTTAAAQPALAGVVVRDALIPFAVHDAAGHTTFRGHLQDRVVRENVSGTLDFYQTVRADAGYPIAAFLQSASRSNFGGATVDANFRTDGIGDPAIRPESAGRTADSQSVRFNFGSDLVQPADTSLVYFAKTKAENFNVSGSTALGFGPNAAVGFGPGSVKLVTAQPVVPAALKCSIAGTVYHDVNGDGVRQLAEPPKGGVQVFLDANNNGVFNLGERTTLSNAAGGYLFNNLPAGAYHVREVKPAGFRVTQPGSGVYHLVLPAGASVAGRDFGNTRTVRISGTVFNDADSDGIRDAGEGGLSGFKVYLDANNNGVLDPGERNVTTGASGSYVFNGMAPGLQHVRIQPKLFFNSTAPAGGVYHLFMASGTTAGSRNFGEHFNPIILPVPIPQPIPIPIPIPDPGPIMTL